MLPVRYMEHEGHTRCREPQFEQQNLHVKQK